MDPVIRQGRRSDLEALAAFTTDTFSWGDYVADRYREWLDDEAALTVVAVDADDVPTALARAALLSSSEIWLHAARVHPSHHRQGLGIALNEHLLEWGRSQGAQVARLLVEDWNEGAQTQVAKAGYRPVSKWAWAKRPIVNRDPQPTGNGGRRVPGPERLKAASAAEAEPAFLSWSTSSLMRMARGLFCEQWTWRRLNVEDLVTAAKRRSLLESPSGWAIVSKTEADDEMRVNWMMSTPDDTFRLVRAILDRAVDTNAAQLAFFSPATVESVEAFVRIGCEIQSSTIWEQAL